MRVVVVFFSSGRGPAFFLAFGAQQYAAHLKTQPPHTTEEINKRPDEYWTLVMDIARKNNIKRIIRCSQIMGRNETDELSAAQIFYPCMQCADIFFLKVLGAPGGAGGCYFFPRVMRDDEPSGPTLDRNFAP